MLYRKKIYTQLVVKEWWDDDSAPFSNDKIRAKSAWILLAAITRIIFLPTGVRHSVTISTQV